MEFLFSLLVITTMLFFPVAGVPLLAFKKKAWWVKRWVKVVAISWLAIYCIGAINSAGNRPSGNAPAEGTTQRQQKDGPQNPEADTSQDVTAEPSELEPEPETERVPAPEESPAEDTAEAPASSTPPQQNYSPSSGVNSTVSGYCNDGTYVTGNPSAKGRANACYGHKGWRDY